MDRRTLLRLGTGAVVALGVSPFVGCASVPASAIAAWRPPVDADDLHFALSHGVLAPNPHNRQPWLLDIVSPTSARLRLDLSRLLPETDPFSRQILIGTGAFLELTSLAAAERGKRAVVDVFPDGVFGEVADDNVVAVVNLVEGGAADPLFAEIPRRHTNRNAYDANRAVTAAEAAAIATAAGVDVRVDVVSGAAAATVRELANEAWRIELITPRTMMESVRLLRVGSAEIDEHRDGLTITSPLLVAISAFGLFDRSKPPAPDSSIITGQVDDFATLMTSTASFFVLTTPGNDRRAQLGAGRAYARAQLAATSLGLVMQPVSQSLQEYPEMKAPWARVHQALARDGETVQMLCRIGVGPAAPPAPRRGLSPLLVSGNAS